MRSRLPTSQATLRFRFSIIDIVCAIVAPPLALVLTDASLLTQTNTQTVVLYCAVWLAFSIISFVAFRLYDALTHHFSTHDALDVAKAVVFTELFTCVVFFTSNRLEGIPRSALPIHALILAVALITTRAIAQALHKGAKANGRNHSARENIIMIGATHAASHYIKLLEAYSSGERRVIALLDDRPKFVGRSMSGIRILTGPCHLSSVIEEFVVHGINADRVIIDDDENLLSDELLNEIKGVCALSAIKLDLLSELLGLDELPSVSTMAASESSESEAILKPDFELPRYFTFRSIFDFIAALAIIVLLLPLFIVSTVLVLLSVGSPVLFWQQRLGRGGRRFMLQKFRTLRPPYDSGGRSIPSRKELSVIGQLLRQTRLDELPQLLNVLVGDMALIGPRPLLPEDQPTNPIIRLMVRPGITGWAQVNGGKLLTPEEKDRYDEYYVRNASPLFDLRIIFMTLRVVFGLTKHTDHEVAAASTVGFGQPESRQFNVTGTRADRARANRREVESPPTGLNTPGGAPSGTTPFNRKTKSQQR